MLHKIFLTLIFVLAFISVGWATDYYVCDTGTTCGTGWVTGNDSNNCTSKSTPCKTIQGCADKVTAGDTCIVGDGTYINYGTYGTSTCAVYMKAGGNSGNPITFKSENKWGAVIDGIDRTTDFAFFWPAETGCTVYSYINIEDFEIKNFERRAIMYNCATGMVDNLRVYRNYIHDCGTASQASNAVTCGAGCVNLTIDSNYIKDTSGHGLSPKGNHIKIVNNIIQFTTNRIDCTASDTWHIQAYTRPTANGGSGYWYIYNNTFVGPGDTSGHLVMYKTAAGDEEFHHVYIDNNISYNTNNYFLYFYPTTGRSVSDFYLRNNLTNTVSIRISGSYGTITESNNQVSTNPQFVDSANNNFHLQSDSPAIDAGLTIVDVTVDYDGNVRPQGTAYDIGMDEYVQLAVPSTYYIDCVNGNDNNTGESQSYPWKTWNKVNNRTLTAGDTYRCKGGVECSNPIIVHDSGTAANKINFGSYGTGRCVINPGGTLTGWTAHSGSVTTVWSVTLNSDGGGADARNRRNVIHGSDLTGSGTKLRFTYTARAAGNALTIDGASVCQRSGSTDDCTASPTRITFNNGNNSSGVIAIGTTKISDDITFTMNAGTDYLVHHYSAAGHAYWRALATPNGKDVYYQDSATSDDTMTQSVAYSLYTSVTHALSKIEAVAAGLTNVYYKTEATEPAWVKFDGVTGTKDTTGCGTTNPAIDEHWCYTGGTLYVRDDQYPSTTITRDTPYGIDFNAKNYITVENLEVKNAGTAGVRMNGADGILKRCSVHDNTGDNILVNGNNNKVGMNIVYDATDDCVSIEGGTGIEVANNILYSCDGDGIYVTGTGTTVTLKNNISTNNTGSTINKTSGTGAITINKNDYMPSTGTPFMWEGVAKNFADWKTACGCDANSYNADPLFVNATNKNFHLLQGSPCVNTGDTISWITEDYDGVTLTGQPDMGAFTEYFPPMSMNAIFCLGMEF